MLLRGQAREVRVGSGIGIADVTVWLHETRHEGRAGSVDDASASSGQATAPLDGRHPLAFHEDVTGKWRGPAAVEDRRIGNQCPVHGVLLDVRKSVGAIARPNDPTLRGQACRGRIGIRPRVRDPG
jgi:hypothetical protein